MALIQRQASRSFRNDEDRRRPREAPTYFRRYDHAAEVPLQQASTLTSLVPYLPPPGRFYTPPEVAYDMPRASSRNPPFHCFFIELANNPARHSFGEAESSSKEAALFGILQAIIDGNVPRDRIRRNLADCIKLAHEIAWMKIKYSLELQRYLQANTLIIESWHSVARGLAMLINEWEDVEESFRVCDKAVILWLVEYLHRALDSQVVNLHEALMRWEENVKLWVTLNYRARPVHLQVLAHTPRMQVEHARAEVARQYNEAPLPAQERESSLPQHVSFDLPLTSTERERIARLPLSQRRRAQSVERDRNASYTGSSRPPPSSDRAANSPDITVPATTESPTTSSYPRRHRSSSNLPEGELGSVELDIDIDEAPPSRRSRAILPSPS